MREHRRRRSLRLQSYDYSWPGDYFVTICVADRMPRFGAAIDSLLRLNDAGTMIDTQWRSLAERFAHVELDAYVVMPNHLHGILRLNTIPEQASETLSSILQAFKSLTTSAYANGVRFHGWPEFDRRLWQQGFYDHVIRDERDLDRVRAYIDANPQHWYQDREYDAWQRSQTGRVHAE